MSESRYADELRRRCLEEWDDKDGISTDDFPVFPDEDLPCFFMIDVPGSYFTFAVDEHRCLWVIDELVDLSDLGFLEMEMRSEEADSGNVEITRH